MRSDDENGEFWFKNLCFGSFLWVFNSFSFVLNLRLELLLLVLNGIFWKFLQHCSIYDEDFRLGFFLPSWEKNKPKTQTKQTKNPTKQQTPKKTAKTHTHKKMARTPHTSTLQTLALTLSNPFCIFFFKEFPCFSICTFFSSSCKIFQLGDIQYCYQRLLGRAVKSDMLCSGLAFKKKVFWKLKSCIFFVFDSEFKVILSLVALLFCVFILS